MRRTVWALLLCLLAVSAGLVWYPYLSAERVSTPFEAAELLQQAGEEPVRFRSSEVDPDTVYRALDVLEEIGLVRHTHLGHGAPTYSADEHEHVHLVCHRCGHIDEVPTDLMDDLADLLQRRRGFALDAAHLALSGFCRECGGDPGGAANRPAEETR